MQENKRRSQHIDILKGISIIAIVLFHSNEAMFPYGYLGVDIFLVIGGFFMLKSIVKLPEDRLSFFSFLWKRIVRLCPLLFCLSAICLAIGYFVMLPDDLENLAESVVASNLFANNILACITTKNYWDVVNELKPLMHTWYLGVLFQAYVVLSLALLFCIRLFGKQSRKFLYCVVFMIALSLTAYFLPCFSAAQKFYYLPFRSFEILLGAFAALMATRVELSKSQYLQRLYPLMWILLVVLLFVPGSWLAPSVKLLLIVLLTAILLLLGETRNAVPVKNYLLSGIALLGMASFSIYIWHQAELAFFR